MIKVRVIEDFHLGKFNELKNIIRANYNKREHGKLYVNDTFECTEEMAEYLMGKNAKKRAFVEVIEVIPEKENTEKKAVKRINKKNHDIDLDNLDIDEIDKLEVIKKMEELEDKKTEKPKRKNRRSM